MSQDLPGAVERTPTPVVASTIPPVPTGSIMQLQIPLPAMMTILVFALGLVTTLAATWFRMTSHAEAKEMHVEVAESVKGGGLAYKNEINALRVESEKRLRKVLKSMQLHCAQDASGGFACRVDLPEE